MCAAGTAGMCAHCLALVRFGILYLETSLFNMHSEMRENVIVFYTETVFKSIDFCG